MDLRTKVLKDLSSCYCSIIPQLSKKDKGFAVVFRDKECEKITYNKQGRILKFFLTVTKDTGVTTAQRLGDNIVDSFSETELGYYDVTIYVESDENTEPYPMIGYKNKNEKAISWTVNKGEVKDEE